MIIYDLQCAVGHAFEGWFASADDFLAQQAKGLVACPICNSVEVSRVISPVRSLTSRGSAEPNQAQPARPGDGSPGPEAAPKVFFRAVRAFLETNFENVGAKFAAEALKIHYGVSPARNIRGSSTDQEEEVLKQEGIKFMKLPLPRDPDLD